MKAPLAHTQASRRLLLYTHTQIPASTRKEGTIVTFGESEKRNKSVSTVSWREGTETASCIIDTLQIEQ